MIDCIIVNFFFEKLQKLFEIVNFYKKKSNETRNTNKKTNKKLPMKLTDATAEQL